MRRGPHGTNNRSFIPETPAERARRLGNIPQAMAEAMITRAALTGDCTDKDLVFAGFRKAEIDEHGDAAREIASRSAERQAA